MPPEIVVVPVTAPALLLVPAVAVSDPVIVPLLPSVPVLPIATVPMMLPATLFDRLPLPDRVTAVETSWPATVSVPEEIAVVLTLMASAAPMSGWFGMAALSMVAVPPMPGTPFRSQLVPMFQFVLVSPSHVRS